jgi:predicted PurR-regulated permease PerM
MIEWLFTTKNGKVMLVVLGIAIPMFSLMMFREFFALIAVSFALTMIMIPIVDNFENRGMKRPLAISLTFIVIILITGAIVFFSYKISVEQFEKMGKSFGVDRPAIGDSVYVQLHSKKIFEGVLQKQDTTTSIIEYGNRELLSWSVFDVQIIVKVGDSILVKNGNGIIEKGILRSGFRFTSNETRRELSSNDEIVSRHNLFKEKLIVFEQQLKQKLSFLNESDISSLVDSFLFFLLDKILGALNNFKTLIGSIAIVPMVTFFFLRDYHKMIKFLIHSVPNKYFEMSLNLHRRLEVLIGQYIRGLVIEFFLVALLSMGLYHLLGLNFAFVLGIFVGMFNIIPLVGAVLGVLPALVISVTQKGNLQFIIPTIFFINAFVLYVDMRYIKKKLYEEIIDIHPLLVLLLILLAGAIMGVTGIILVVPIYITLALTARETSWGLTSYQITSV